MAQALSEEFFSKSLFRGGPIEIVNRSGAIIPAYGLVRVGGMESVNNRRVVSVEKPSETDTDPVYLANGPSQLSDGDVGIAAAFGTGAWVLGAGSGPVGVSTSSDWEVEQSDTGQLNGVGAGSGDFDNLVFCMFRGSAGGSEEEKCKETEQAISEDQAPSNRMVIENLPFDGVLSRVGDNYVTIQNFPLDDGNDYFWRYTTATKAFGASTELFHGELTLVESSGNGGLHSATAETIWPYSPTTPRRLSVSQFSLPNGVVLEDLLATPTMV